MFANKLCNKVLTFQIRTVNEKHALTFQNIFSLSEVHIWPTHQRWDFVLGMLDAK
jgi:hypothetical protein